MFLYLSKLLPLFLYPLGLACLFLLLAMGLLWKWPRLAALFIGVALVLLLGSSNGWVSNWLVRSLEFQYVPATPLPQADAIVVLGGATRSALSPRPWVEVNEAGDRVLYGAKLYREGKAPRLILSGGQINGEGPESADMAELIESMGVPKSAILQDPTSLNTRQNAVNVKYLMTTNGIHRILLVTSALHMPRSLAIFRKLEIEAIPAPTDYLMSVSHREITQHSPQALVLNLLPDAGQLKESTLAIKEYVGIFVYRLRGWL